MLYKATDRTREMLVCEYRNSTKDEETKIEREPNGERYRSRKRSKRRKIKKNKQKLRQKEKDKETETVI